MNRYIEQNVLCVGNVQLTIVDCFVSEAFREYHDDLRDHISDNTINRPKSETSAVLRLECSIDCIRGSVGHQQNIFRSFSHCQCFL